MEQIINKYNIFILFIIFLAFYMVINLKLIPLVIIGTIVFLYFYNKYQIENNIIKKKNSLRQICGNSFDNNPEIIHFLFSIQEFYYYNPVSYDEFIKNLNIFFEIYDDAKNNNYLASQKFNDLKLIRRDVLNSLHSIVFSINPTHNDILINKLNSSLEKIMELLNFYITDIHIISKNYIRDNGYNHRTTVLLDSPYMQKNIYDTGVGRYSSIYSYQYY